MACHGGFSLDEKVRRTWYNPEKILAKSGLREGMFFADIGSGDGFFSLLAAKVVGTTGKVFAADSDGTAIDRLKLKAAENGLPNINAIEDEAERAVFCHGCVDVVFFSMVLHDFYNPIKVLQNAKSMLKVSGTRVDLDWKKMTTPFGPPETIRFSEEKVQELLKQVGLRAKEVESAGSYHYLVTATL